MAPKKHHTLPPTRGYYGREVGWLCVTALVGLSLLGFARRDHYRHIIERSRKVLVARTQMTSAARNIKLYCLATGHLPPDVDDYLQPKNPWFRSAKPGLDPWGNHYQVLGTGARFTITSAGPDGEWGTSDDLTRSVRIEPGR